MVGFDFHLFCCTNRRPEGHKGGCCASKGGEELRAYFKEQVKAKGIAATRVNSAGCLDRCAAGPVVVVYPEGVWYSLPDKAAIDRVISLHLQGGVPVAEYQIS